MEATLEKPKNKKKKKEKCMQDTGSEGDKINKGEQTQSVVELEGANDKNVVADSACSWEDTSEVDILKTSIDVVKDKYLKEAISSDDFTNSEPLTKDDSNPECASHSSKTETLALNETTQCNVNETHIATDGANTALVKTEELTDDFHKILNINKQIANVIKHDQLDLKFLNADKIRSGRLSVKNVDNTKSKSIRPYTESQLAALYCNSELDMLEQFTSQFVEAELRGISIKQHSLYDLLSNYLHVREKITENNLELEQLRKEYGELQGTLWSCEKVSVSGRGECQDGNIVVATHYYNKATFHRSVFQSLVRVLGNINKLIYEKHVFYSYSAEELRLQIELYMQTIIMNLLNLTKVDRNAPVNLVISNEPAHLKPYVSEVRLSISVLFAFQRKLICDQKFLNETREWLCRLIAVLLRIANYQDHLFILNHILRCPAGVSTWASCFIQTPLEHNSRESPFASYQINHILTILAAILMPIRFREKFLEDIAQVKENSSDILFVVVDSEGEEDEEPSGTSLKENDLVALLNQLPIDDLFRTMLLVEKKNFEDTYDGTQVTEHHILRFFAFSTVFLKLLYKGLQTYNQPRYNQFSKRLCRFIRHIVQYATDQWEYFQKVQRLDDSAMMQRLQIEYDAFFLRAIYYLYSSQKLGAWQFLAVIPYNIVSIECLWKIFYFLHDSDSSAKEILTPTDDGDYSEKIWHPSLRAQFQEKIGSLDDVESYYLLNTFANMALARPESDMVFIFCATTDLLQIGFMNLTTQESCSKSARILLTHITSKYPHLLTDILKEVRSNMDKIGELALYLYEELPLSVWRVSEEDLQTICRLLRYPNTSNESKLARMIISRLNWDSDESGKLFLPYEVHCDTALLVVEAVDEEPSYSHWGWQTILRLKLHINDKGFTEIGRVKEVEVYSAIQKGVRELKPLACFVSVLMTTWGHLVPLICTKGLQQLQQIQAAQQRHEAVLFALYVLVPVFVGCQECLVNSERFQALLAGLLAADRGYVSMARGLLVGAQSTTVLQQFGNMVEAQLVECARYGLDGPRPLSRLWANSLVSLPGWSRDPGALYLLDVVVRAAFFHAGAAEAVRGVLKDLIQASSPQDQGGTISSLFKWVSSGTGSGTLISSSLSSCTWLAYTVIELEFEEREKRTGFWRELLIQLSKQQGKVNVDAAIKKAANAVKISSFSSGSLCIYRFAQQAMDTPIDHPLLPLLWHKFFTLYLARVPVYTTVDKGCVGEKFFDGLVNFTFFKKIKRHLEEVLNFYQEKCDVKEDDDLPETRRQFYNNCVRIFRAYSLWLEEPMVQEANLHLPSLPPHYEPKLLALIIQDNKTPWYEFLDYERIKEEQRASIKTWRLSNFREKSNVNKPLLNPGSRLESDNPVERILKRIQSYDVPKPAPNINNTAPVVPGIDFTSQETMFKSLDHAFRILKQFAHNQMLRISEHKALDCSYQELVPQLYRSVLNKVKSKVPCKGKNQTVLCSGPAIIVLEMQEARVYERIDHQIQTNRNAYESLVTKTLQLPALSLCTASVTIQQAVKILQAQRDCNVLSAQLGVELFYYILSLLNEETNAYLPTKSLFSSCLERLGQTHIFAHEGEMPRLLEKIIKEPGLGCYLAPHFSPHNVTTVNLLAMYATITQEIGRKYDVAFSLLSKFEIENWLKLKQPKICQRSQLIEHVMRALVSLGFEPCVDSLMLHGLYRKHLLTVFEFQFPEHYGEIMMQLLRASNGTNEASPLALSVWMDIINSLARPGQIHLKVPMRDQLRQYAQQQQALNYQELLETAELLGDHFARERLQYGLYGLYPRARAHCDVYALLLGMAGHALVLRALTAHQGELGERVCERVWPPLRHMFAPWLVPYAVRGAQAQTTTGGEEMAAWIRQLADELAPLPPWIAADVVHARKMAEAFVECVQFVVQVLPASGNILSFVWQWYVTNFAHNLVKEHVLNVIHHSLITLPWGSFWPTVNDLESMLQVVDQFLPECHYFLGYVFMQVSWANWMRNFDHSPLQMRSRVYQCFLGLLVKLSNEPNVRNKHADKAKGLLVQAENFDWEVLDASVYQHVTDWYVLSCDPFVIFKTDPLDLDFRVLHFLRAVSGYDKPLPFPAPNQQKKRSMFLRSHVRLVSVFACKHKTSVPSKEYELSAVISFQLNHLESVVQSQEELVVLIVEILYLLNVQTVSKVTLQCFNKWIAKKPGDSVIVKVLLQTVGAAVTDYNIISELYENILTSYFQNNINENFEPRWQEVADYLKIVPHKQTELEQCLITGGKLLTLTAVLVQKIKKGTDGEILMNLCLEWLSTIKVTEQLEVKVPLIWFGLLYLAYNHCKVDETCVGTVLYNFVQILLETSEDRKNSGSWGRGLLNAIGLARQENISNNFKFLCRALACYVLAQLPMMKGGPQQVRHIENAPSRVGQPGGNTECAKILLKLDFGQSQGKIKDCAELALNQIQDSTNSLHNADKFLTLLLKQFYIKPYFRNLM